MDIRGNQRDLSQYIHLSSATYPRLRQQRSPDVSLLNHFVYDFQYHFEEFLQYGLSCFFKVHSDTIQFIFSVYIFYSHLFHYILFPAIFLKIHLSLSIFKQKENAFRLLLSSVIYIERKNILN